MGSEMCIRDSTPDDEFEALNMEGVITVINFTEDLLRAIDAMDKAPTFVKTERTRRRRPTRPPVLGVVPSLGTDANVDGVPIEAVRPDSPAKKAGIQVGDVITTINGKEVDQFEDLIGVLRNNRAGDEITIGLKRKDEQKTVKATLAR